MSFFLIPQLITSTLEAAINKLAHLDPTFQERCKVLVGKRLLVQVEELKVPLLFVVTEQQISVLSSKDSKNEANDCAIGTSLAALKSLQDPNQITKLIKENQLTLTGDLQLAQQVSQLIKQTQIDWEAHLAYYLGDGLAHKVANGFSHFGQLMAQKNQDLSRILTELAQDEVQISPHPSQVQQFSQRVNQTRAKVDRLAAKIANMSPRKR